MCDIDCMISVCRHIFTST